MKVALTEAEAKSLCGEGAVAEQKLGGRRLHLSEESISLTPKAGSQERNGFMDAWGAKGTVCRAEWENH